MFWRVSGLNTASPVDSILDKEAYSLEELLDEDEVIQECKSLNARLTAYLKQKDTVEKLLRYLVEVPPPDADPKRSFKYPFTACEIFCCEVEGIFNTLLEHDDLLARLFSLLQAPRPLNSMLAGYFSRLMGSLLLRRTQDVMQYLQRHQELLQQLVDHVDTTSIAEVLVRLVGADEQRAFLSTNHLQWLSDTNLLYLLLDKLRPGQPEDAQSNASEILAALAQSQVSPLARNLADPGFLELLVQRALRQPDDWSAPASPAATAAQPGAEAGSQGTGAGPDAAGQVQSEPGATAAQSPNGSTAAAAAAKEGQAAGAQGKAGAATPQQAPVDVPDAANPPASLAPPPGSGSVMTHALNVCIALVEPLPPTPGEQQAAAQGLGLGGMPAPAVDISAAEVHAAMRAQATQCIARSVDRLVALLEAAEPDRQLPTSYGLLRPPVGMARLKAVELLAALLHSGDAAAERAVMGTQGVQRTMQLFLSYPFNNVLHRHCAAALTSLEHGSDALARFLLEDCSLLRWLAEAPLQVTPLPRPGDVHAEQRRPLRAGYAGHITLIANRLMQVANDGHAQLRAAMERDAPWQAWVREVLEPRNAQENVFAWKCGRPTMHEPVGDTEGELFQADLDYGGSEGEALSRDVYQRYGVFATHEEEEVDPEQPSWALELAQAAGGASAAAATGPGKLAPPPAGGPHPFPVYDSSSSSSGGSSDEEGDGAQGQRSDSEEGEVSVAPAPPDGDALLAGGGGGAVLSAARLSLGGDDADMADDAVMLEYDAAEQLVSLSQLSLEDAPGGAAAAGGDAGTNDSAAATGAAGGDAEAQRAEPQQAGGQAVAAGSAQAQEELAAPADSSAADKHEAAQQDASAGEGQAGKGSAKRGASPSRAGGQAAGMRPEAAAAAVES